MNQFVNIAKILNEGDNAFIFEAYSLQEREVTIRNKNAFLIFINPSCKSCPPNVEKISPYLMAWQEKGVEVIGVISAKIEVAREYSKNNSMFFPLIADEQNLLFKKYYIRATPSMIIINKSGKIVFILKYNEKFDSAIKRIENVINQL